MHDWSDRDVDWPGISDAAYWIGKQLMTYGRMGVSDMKEKFGTVRVYVSFGWYQFHTIFKPGYHYSQWPKWLWYLDCVYGSRAIWLLNYVAIPYHKWLYRQVYKQALKKWPHLAKEILCGADWTELLVGLHPDLIYEQTGENSFSIGWKGDPEEEDMP